MPDETRKDIEAADALWKEIKERAKALKFGSFRLDCKIHAGMVKEIEVHDVREKLRATN